MLYIKNIQTIKNITQYNKPSLLYLKRQSLLNYKKYTNYKKYIKNIYIIYIKCSNRNTLYS